MTYEEAIKHINVVKSRIRGGDEAYDIQRKEALNTAIEALEKQIPKKPIEIQSPVIKWGLCPNCRGEFNKFGNQPNRVLGSQMFCPDCGQALDWECK